MIDNRSPANNPMVTVAATDAGLCVFMGGRVCVLIRVCPSCGRGQRFAPTMNRNILLILWIPVQLLILGSLDRSLIG